jgi:hypothetical protein
LRRHPLPRSGHNGKYTTESVEGGAMYRLREGFSFFLANSHNRRKNKAPDLQPVPHAVWKHWHPEHVAVAG